MKDLSAFTKVFLWACAPLAHARPRLLSQLVSHRSAHCWYGNLLLGATVLTHVLLSYHARVRAIPACDWDETRLIMVHVGHRSDTPPTGGGSPGGSTAACSTAAGSICAIDLSISDGTEGQA
jgi:hypothetical protein